MDVTTRDRIRRVGWVLVIVAASLGVASALHLTGHVHGRGKAFDPDDAGIAEAVIGVVLIGGVAGMFARPARARTIGLSVTGFAIVGFLVGLSETARGGHLPDIGYHLVTLPILIGCLATLVRTGPAPRTVALRPTSSASSAGGAF